MNILCGWVSAIIRRLVVEGAVPVSLHGDCGRFSDIELDRATGDCRHGDVSKPTEFELSVDTRGHCVQQEDVGDGKYVSVWKRDGGRKYNDSCTNVESDSCSEEIEIS